MDMSEIVQIDFEVEFLGQVENRALFGGTKKAFHHFVVFEEKDGYNQLSQFLLHRFELANRLTRLSDGEESSCFKLAATDIEFCLQSYRNKVEQSDEGEVQSRMTLSFDCSELQFPLTGSTFGNRMIQDALLLTEIQKKSGTKSFRKKAIQSILGEFDEEKVYSFSKEDLIIAIFESKLSKNNKYSAPHAEIRKILAIQEIDTSQLDIHMVDDLISVLPVVVSKKSCDCGSEGCFFDLLKSTYNHFFIEEDILTHGEIDETKVEYEFNKVWKKLTSKQQIALSFLDNEFCNTPLLNLYLCTPGCNIEEYLSKMTYPYQPDSEDALFVRSTASLAYWWLNG
jgi:hypothetical protein